jgi:hypothetical protein
MNVRDKAIHCRGDAKDYGIHTMSPISCFISVSLFATSLFLLLTTYLNDNL